MLPQSTVTTMTERAGKKDVFVKWGGTKAATPAVYPAGAFSDGELFERLNSVRPSVSAPARCASHLPVTVRVCSKVPQTSSKISFRSYPLYTSPGLGRCRRLDLINPHLDELALAEFIIPQGSLGTCAAACADCPLCIATAFTSSSKAAASDTPASASNDDGAAECTCEYFSAVRGVTPTGSDGSGTSNGGASSGLLVRVDAVFWDEWLSPVTGTSDESRRGFAVLRETLGPAFGLASLNRTVVAPAGIPTRLPSEAASDSDRNSDSAFKSGDGNSGEGSSSNGGGDNDGASYDALASDAWWRGLDYGKKHPDEFDTAGSPLVSKTSLATLPMPGAKKVHHVPHVLAADRRPLKLCRTVLATPFAQSEQEGGVGHFCRRIHGFFFLFFSRSLCLNATLCV